MHPFVRVKIVSCASVWIAMTHTHLAADSVNVAALRAAGAVPFVRTNVPQTLLTYETVNTVFGRTVNPWNTKRSPGRW